MEAVSLAINKKYEVLDFILRIGMYPNNPNKISSLFELKYSNVTVKYQIIPEIVQNLLRNSQLYCINDQIYISNSNLNEKGYIEFTWISQYKDNLIIKMKYDVVPNADLIANFLELNQFIQTSIENYQELNHHIDQEGKIYRFLTPHLQGVERDIARMKKTLKISYRLDGTKITLLGYKEKALYEYARNHRSNNPGNKIGIEVQINKKVGVVVHWDSSSQSWMIEERDRNRIPTHGQMEIQLGNPDSARKTLSHDERRLIKMKDALFSMKDNLKSPGNTPLKELLDLDSEEINSARLGPDWQRILEFVGLKNKYNHFDKDQQNTIDQINSHSISFITGEAGTGKTEVGAFVSLIAALGNNRCLVTSETNDAVKNILERIYEMIQKGQLTEAVNIVRIHSRNDRISIPNLAHFELENVIEFHKQKIETKCSEKSSDAEENNLKAEFKRIFANSENLTEIIPLTFDIVLSTYGSMAERRFKKLHIPEFEFNLIEASSGINTATFATSGAYARNWIFLDDQLQLSPTTIGMFIPKQKMRFPEKNEMENAKEYNPNRLDQKRTPKGWGEWEYNKGVKAILTFKDEANKIAQKNLWIQYRIHPKLYELICKSFPNLTFKQPPQQDASLFLDLSALQFFRQAKNRVIYCDCNSNTLVATLTQKLNQAINELRTASIARNKQITIGVTGLDVALVRAFIKEYRQSSVDLISDEQIENSYSDQVGNIKIHFSSIKKHQEKQYDIFFMGTNLSKAPSFLKQLYTAITRARSYVVLCGPSMETRHKNSANQSNPRINVLSSLRKGVI